MRVHGKSLWLLDGGVTPYFDVDWADHVVPVARGGQSTLANGVAACFSRNAEKRDLVGQHTIQFIGGKPTRAYLKMGGTVPRIYGAISSALPVSITRIGSSTERSFGRS